LRVWAALRASPGPFESRDEAVTALTTRGFSPALAGWLATNIERVDERYRWRFNLEALAELLQDYFVTDMWPFLESGSTPELHLLSAEQSDRWSPAISARLEQLPATSRVHHHRLEASGHWVHVDNPEGLLHIMAEHIRF
jgi:pimeloyl-ACP methyl ester carboxylesterase